MLVIILLAGLKFTAGLEMIDITGSDDICYMFRGINIFQKSISAEYSPLYSLLYRMVWIPCQNTVTTYYIVQKLVTVLPCILLYAVLRKNKIHIFISVVVSVFFLTSQMNFPVLPKPSHFALSIVLGTLVCVREKGSISSNMGVVAIGSLIASYVRPEFFPIFICTALLCMVTSIIGLRNGNPFHALAPSFFVILASLLIIPASGIPAFSEAGREMVAFGQHFSLNWVRWNDSDLDPMRDWQKITTDNFADSKNITEAACKNPRLFAKHLVYNSVRLAAKPIKLATPHPLANPHIYSKFSGLFLFGMLGLYLLKIRNNLVSRLRQTYDNYKITLLPLLILCIPGITSSLLIYPRDHYLLIPGAMAMIVVSMVINPDVKFRNTPTLNVFTALGVLLIVPVMSDIQKSTTDNKNSILDLISMNIKEPVNILASEELYAYFLGPNYQNVSAHSKNSDFQTFLKDKNITLIVLSRDLDVHPKFINDPTWHEFISNCDTFGFSSHTVSNSGNRILISKSID